MQANVYVDGFNLYYRCLKGATYPWLDIKQLCRTLLPRNDINRIRYFTALVESRMSNPTQPQRQQLYLRALQTLPELTIHYGAFLSTTRWAQLANAGGKVQVMNSEEKGLDVNLASHLLMDAFRQDFEVALVISNDSDLVEPIRMVRDERQLRVGMLNPRKRQSRELQQAAGFIRPVRAGALATSQVPDVLHDANGSFHKPPSW